MAKVFFAFAAGGNSGFFIRFLGMFDACSSFVAITQRLLVKRLRSQHDFEQSYKCPKVPLLRPFLGSIMRGFRACRKAAGPLDGLRGRWTLRQVVAEGPGMAGGGDMGVQKCTNWDFAFIAFLRCGPLSSIEKG